MPFEWVATEMRTGAVIETLADLQVASVADAIGSSTTTQANLPLSTAPAAWLRATKPGATVLNLIETDHNICVWGGYITQRVRSDAETVQLALATIPAYFERRYVGGKTYTDTDQNVIAKDLVESFAAAGSNGGIPIRVNVLDTGLQRNEDYEDSDDKTLISVLQDLSGLANGIEWFVRWESGMLADGRAAWTPVIDIGGRIGNSAPEGLAPAVTPEFPGQTSSVNLTEDYSSDSGANDVIATSSASGDGYRPQSDRHTYADPDRPTFERRFTPATSADDTTTLEASAEGKLAELREGATEISMSFTSSIGRALGVDWSIGDDLGYKLAGPAFPNGAQGVARAWGWEITLDDPVRVTPTLTQPGGANGS